MNVLEGRVPIFASWHDDGGASVNVQLYWHPTLPDVLPENNLCTVHLCTAKSPPQFLEAILERHHLQGVSEMWSSKNFERLMSAMIQPNRDRDDFDRVVLRNESSRMVIDVIFQEPCKESRLVGRVVEILNAYPSVTSLRSSTTQFLRSIASAQRANRDTSAGAQVQMDSSHAQLASVEHQWQSCFADSLSRHRDYLRRFALLLEAKVQKEQALVLEVDQRRRARMFAAAASTASAVPPPSAAVASGLFDEAVLSAPLAKRAKVAPPVRRPKMTPPAALIASASEPANSASGSRTSEVATQAKASFAKASLPPLMTQRLFDPGSSSDEDLDAPTLTPGPVVAAKSQGVGSQIGSAPAQRIDGGGQAALAESLFGDGVPAQGLQTIGTGRAARSSFADSLFGDDDD